MDKDYIVCNFCMEFRKERDVYNNGDLWKTYSMELELPLQVAPNVGDIIELGGFNWRADFKVVSRQFGATVLENILNISLPKNGYITSDELGLPLKNSNLVLPCGIFARWEKEKYEE